MRQNRISSFKLFGIALSLGLTAAGANPVPAVAQERAAAVDLPILFDTRERIAKPDLSGIVRLRFLTTVDFPPFNFIDQTGKLAGFHVDLVREIPEALKPRRIEIATTAPQTPRIDSPAIEGEAAAA